MNYYEANWIACETLKLSATHAVCACLTNNDLYRILNFQYPNFEITQHFS